MTAQLDMFASSPAAIAAPTSRAPFSDDELVLHAALKAIADGSAVEWSTMWHLVGAGYVHAARTRLVITDEGRAFLASSNSEGL